jgi:dihydrodipicolinate synthase/N-acetylneuraminate lyase
MSIDNKIQALKSALTGGVSPAMATPLQPDGYTIATEVVPPLVQFLADRGVAGLFVGGTTGEGVALDFKQREILHETAVSAVSRLDQPLPLLLHVGANSTREALSLTKHAAEIGAAAIVAVTPWFFGMDDDALFSYFATLAAATPDTPFMAYDIPQSAVNGLSPALLGRLCAEIPNFAGLKCSRTDIQVIRRLLDARAERTIFLAGNEPISLGSLALGADGLISGLSTAVPEPFVALTAAFAAGDIGRARAVQRQINQLLPCLPDGRRLGGIKQLLAERGIPVGPVVPPRPMPPPGAAIWPRMAAILER